MIAICYATKVLCIAIYLLVDGRLIHQWRISFRYCLVNMQCRCIIMVRQRWGVSWDLAGKGLTRRQIALSDAVLRLEERNTIWKRSGADVAIGYSER